MSPLLIQEPPLQVLPSLAVKIGLNEAIVLQQLYYLLREPRFGKRIAEQQWIFNTVEQWRASYFPFWSEKTIIRTFTSLREKRLVITCQPEGNLSRRMYYRINFDALNGLIPSGEIGSGQNGKLEMDNLSKSKRTKCPLPITKTTDKDFLQNNNNVADVVFSMPTISEFVSHYLSKMKKDDKGGHLPLVNWLHNQHTWCHDRWMVKPPKDWRNSTGAFTKRYIEYWYEKQNENEF